MERPTGYGWPQWFSRDGGGHVWNDSDPWCSRDAITGIFPRMSESGIFCNGIWRIKQWHGDRK